MDKTTQVLRVLIFTLLTVGVILSAIGLLLTLTGFNMVIARLCSALGVAITGIAAILIAFYCAK